MGLWNFLTRNSNKPKIGRWFYNVNNRFEYCRVVKNPVNYDGPRVRTVEQIQNISDHIPGRTYGGDILDYTDSSRNSDEISNDTFKIRYRRLTDTELLNQLETRYQEVIREYQQKVREARNVLTRDEERVRERLNRLLRVPEPTPPPPPPGPVVSAVRPSESLSETYQEFLARIRRDSASTSVSGISIVTQTPTVPEPIGDPVTEIKNDVKSNELTEPVIENKSQKVLDKLD